MVAIAEPISSEPDALPDCLCPWPENSNGLVSLWIMFQLYAHAFVKVLDDIQSVENDWARPRPGFTESDFIQLAGNAGERVRALRQDCETLHLPSAIKQIREITDRTGTNDPTAPSDMPNMLKELRRRVREDLEDRAFFCIDLDKTVLYFERDTSGPFKGQLKIAPAERVFGQGVYTNLNSAIIDADEAIRCLVFDRCTACVFHLMRVMEVGMRVLATTLKLPVNPKANPTWDAILKKCDDEIRKPYDQKSPEWASNQEFFENATAYLRSVKVAWRNPGMHIEKVYNEEQAADIFTCVRIFMQHLAISLKEPA